MKETNKLIKILERIKNFFVVFPVILSMVILAAHFSRHNIPNLTLFTLFFPLILFSKREWVKKVTLVFLILGFFEWIRTTYILTMVRIQIHQPFIRMIIILVTVAILTLISGLVFKTERLKKRYSQNSNTASMSAWAFILTSLVLFIASIKTPIKILLADRFLPGAGGIEILLLATYSAFISEKLFNSKKIDRIRSKIWLFFSIVFFSQLILGLLGLNKFLMTGKLHLPVPAMIVGGPIYRGYGLFMPILLIVTIIFVGPAWCSYLCYIGAWDNTLARKTKIPKAFSVKYRIIQGSILIAIALGAYLLKSLGVNWVIASVLGGLFGIIGVGIMIFVSRKLGVLVHCTTYCPIGIITTTLGKLNPFRIRINRDTCTNCMACTYACRYNSLTKENVKNGKAGFFCTLCGDCLTACPHSSIEYAFYNKYTITARKVFFVLIAVFHAVFLGVARI
ncbi:4Fe-4S ferredoxin [Thermotomaculum hydrothermale]|uniref:4Fe-4S ferredoxin n=1 Tax=Thermotomaculum hydrothermale TaxID=981385 RepID=A0A7R6PVY0_9BACT|nr:4Fe-4S dicluster domain-containing protein [Thermotomaculum hydrothermale]BBB33642.1 4Fe-4S ferredoxin [Thermotomaculum hydrothermale]